MFSVLSLKIICPHPRPLLSYDSNVRKDLKSVSFIRFFYPELVDFKTFKKKIIRLVAL